MSPRPRKSIAQHKLENTEIGYVTDSAHSGSLPRAPKHLSKEAKKTFRRLVRQLADRRTVTAGDTDLIAIYASISERWLEAREKVRTEGLVKIYTRLSTSGNPVDVERLNLHLSVVEKCDRQMVSILTRLGLTPRDREAVRQVAPPVKKTPDELYAEQLANEPEPEPAPRKPLFAPGELDELLSKEI